MKNFNLIKPVIDVFKNAIIGEFERDNSDNKDTTNIEQIPHTLRVYSEPKINVNITVNVNVYRGYKCPIDGQNYVDQYN